MDKHHPPVWQAWGVLETRHGNAQSAREVFQQGIWACAQSSGHQSGGRRCARLWQAWGVLESREGDVAAARRCFSRALDADGRNVASISAWTRMEEDLGNFQDARSIFEREYCSFCEWRLNVVMQYWSLFYAQCKQIVWSYSFPCLRFNFDSFCAMRRLLDPQAP